MRWDSYDDARGWVQPEQNEHALNDGFCLADPRFAEHSFLRMLLKEARVGSDRITEILQSLESQHSSGDDNGMYGRIELTICLVGG